MKNFLLIFKYSMLILGTLIGAGLASGQEIVVFFAQYGFVSLFFLILLFFAFFYGINLFLNIGSSRIRCTCDFKSKKVFKLFDTFSIFVFIIIGSAMLAGLNELLNQIIYSFSFPVWSLIFAIVSTIVVFFGLKALLNLSAYLVPIIVISIICVCCMAPTVSANSAPAFSTDVPNVFLLALSTISYACCNLVTANKVLFNSGEGLSKKQIKSISLVVAFVLIIIIGAIISSILINDEMVLFSELPLVYMSFLISNFAGYFFSSILILSILTTLFSTQYSFVDMFVKKVMSNDAEVSDKKLMCFIHNEDRRKITIIKKKSRKKLLPFLISMVIFYSVSLFGFQEIIKYSYPIIGAVGFLMIIYLRKLSFKSCLYTADDKIHSAR